MKKTDFNQFLTQLQTIDIEQKQLPLSMEKGIAVLDSVKLEKSQYGNPFIRLTFLEKGYDEEDRRGVDVSLRFASPKDFQSKFNLLKYLFHYTDNADILTKASKKHQEYFEFIDTDKKGNPNIHKFKADLDSSDALPLSKQWTAKKEELYEDLADDEKILSETDSINGVVEYTTIKIDKDAMEDNAKLWLDAFNQLKDEEFHLSCDQDWRDNCVIKKIKKA